MNVITLTLSHTVHVISFSISLKNTLLCVSKIVTKSYFKFNMRENMISACLHSMPGSYKDIKIYLSIFLTIPVLKKKYTLARLYLDDYIKEFKLLKPCVLVSNAKLEKKVSCQMVSFANEI